MNANQLDNGEISMKPLKLCYNNEIHRVSKNPVNYEALVESVLKAFKNDLPQNWVLQYEDSDGDKIMLTSDEDYKSMIESEAESDSKSTKIFIIEMNRNPLGMSTSHLNANEFSRGQISDTYSKITQILHDEIKAKEEENLEQSNEKKIPEPVEQNKEEVIQEKESEVKIEEPQALEVPLHENVEPEVQQQIIHEIESVMKKEKDLQQELANGDKAEPVIQETESIIMEKEDLQNPKQEALQSEERILEIQPTEIVEESLGEKIQEKLLELLQQKPLEENIIEIPEEKNPELKGIAIFEEREKSEKERLKPLMKEILMESVPEICSFVEKYLLEKYPSSFNPELVAQKPKIEHSHSLIKIKEPEQSILNVLQEDILENNPILERADEDENNNSQQKPIPEKTEKIIRPVIEEVKNEEIKSENPQRQVDVENKESKVDITFVKEICTVPTKITINDKAVYKTISLKNTGKIEWPTNSFLRNTSGVKGQDAKLVNLVPGKEFSCILILENPAVDGSFESTWRMAFYDENKNVQYAGKPFTVHFNVQKPEISKVLPKEEKNPFIPIKKEEPSKTYDKGTMEKARQVKEILPDTDIDKIYEFIKKSPNSTLEQIIDQFIA